MNKFLAPFLFAMILLGGCSSVDDSAPRYMLNSDVKFNLTHEEYIRHRNGALKGDKDDANAMMRFHLQKSAFTEEFPMLP